MNKKNKIKAIVAFAVALAFILPTSAVFVNDEGTLITVQPVMSILPATQTVEKDDSFTVDVYIDPEDYLISGADMDLLSFDETVIQADSMTFKDFFGTATVYRVYGTINNTLGEITLTSELTTPFVGVGTANVWITVDFTAIYPGTSSITMVSGGFPDENGNKIEPITIINGEVIVTVEYFYTLDIGVEGNGTTDPAPGTHTYPENTIVDLEAIHDPGWSFDHWDGDVANSSSAITNITMNENKVVTSHFTEDQYTLDIIVDGNGTVTKNPDKTYYFYNESVNLTAIADPQWAFKEWSGDLNGSENPETINMTGDKEITATFTEEQYVLDITINGSGAVIKNPNQETYTYGTSVNLTAVPDIYWAFKEWSGDLSGNETLETIIMDGDKDVTATFIGDITPPVTNYTLDPPKPNGDNGWYTVPVKVTLTATDDWSGVATTWYRWETQHYKWYDDKPFIVSGDKKHTLEYFSIDRANNVEPAKKVVIKIDTKPPVTTHKFDGMIGESGWFISNVTVTLSARDATSGVNYTMYRMDDGNWTKYAEPFNVTEDGIYTICYYSVDLAGHVETNRTAPLKIEKDLIPPVTEHAFAGIMGDNGWYRSDVTVTLTATDNAAGVDYTMYKSDDGGWTKYNNPFPVREDGNHELTYYSVDKVGNIEDDKSATFKIDKTSPTIVLDAEGAGSTWLLEANVNDETSGIAKVEFFVDGVYLGNDTSEPYEWEYTGARRGDIAQAIAYDNAGNLKISNEKRSQDQDAFIGWTFIIGLISNVEEAENIITAQAIRLRYFEVAPTGTTVGFAMNTAVEFSSHNLLGRRTSRPSGRMSLVIGIFKGGITIEDE